jgi:acyl carrier protein
MKTSLLKRVQNIASDVLQVPAQQLTPQSSPQQIENWDSVHHLNLVLALEQQFEVQLDPEDIDQMTSIEQIVSVLERKLPADSTPA